MKKNFRTKVQKLTNGALATFSLRITETVTKSEIDQAKNSKQYMVLADVNARYQALIKPVSHKEISKAVNNSYEKRQQMFKTMLNYVSGLLNSPNEETKLAAEKVYKVLNGFGSNIHRAKIADQTIRYIRIIEMLQATEMEAAIQKLQLGNSITELDAVQRDYESYYTTRGDEQLSYTYPTAMRKELIEALVLHYEECCWLAKQNETDAWDLLVATIEKRLTEVSISRTVTVESVESTTEEPKTA